MYQNYITGQTALSLTLDFSLPKNHLASVISSFVDSIPAEYSQAERLKECLKRTCL